MEVGNEYIEPIDLNLQEQNLLSSTAMVTTIGYIKVRADAAHLIKSGFSLFEASGRSNNGEQLLCRTIAGCKDVLLMYCMM